MRERQTTMFQPIQVLLVGPTPPPNGGISVHVASAHRLLTRAGARCEVLDTGAGDQPATSRRARAIRLAKLFAGIRRHARSGFTVHVHTNGHNRRSWLLALLCALAARGTPTLLTLHSGMAADYLTGGGRIDRGLARATASRYRRVLCVNTELHSAVAGLGVASRRLEVAPAYLPTTVREAPEIEPPRELARFFSAHRPLLVTSLAFRPEYGFPVLLEALRTLGERHPRLGCVVLGGGEGEAQARREVAASDVDSRLLLAGDLPHSLCLAVVSRADLFVRATLRDGDAVSVREAIALGVPVVASDVGHRPPEVRLFPVGDAGALAALADSVLTGVPAGLAETPREGVPRRDDLPWTPAQLVDAYRSLATEAAR